MYFKLFFSISLVTICVSSPAILPKLTEDTLALLTKLQAEHYGHVISILDNTDKFTNALYFVDEDLKANAEVYFTATAENHMSQLAPLKDACAETDACLACFDNETRITAMSQNATVTLVEFFEAQKEEYQKTITELKGNLQSGAYLSTEIYEKFKGSKSFEDDAKNYHQKIQKALVYELSLFSNTITDTINSLVSYNIEKTAKVTEGMQNVFDGIVECADEAMNDIELYQKW